MNLAMVLDYKDYKDYKVQIFNYKRNCQDNNHISSIINKNCKVENQDHSSIQHICPISILSSVIVSSNSILKYCSPAGVCAARQRFADLHGGKGRARVANIVVTWEWKHWSSFCS